ncbi:hypothetical protein [Streptomyces sp. BK205]|uniref:hypothetical protein n=1 Tax=Streptomyces sp. BK205 TaxID=2512164 RepID=UPI001052CFC8|nr:hypothetical protein [Streptomyces sp. BK205]TCR26585.1 hypothetical protein EV578_101535 [Streptomyces sp. BK205]
MTARSRATYWPFGVPLRLSTSPKASQRAPGLRDFAYDQLVDWLAEPHFTRLFLMRVSEPGEVQLDDWA